MSPQPTAETYAALYQENPTYGHGIGRIADFLPRMHRTHMRSVLCLGCGSGDELRLLNAFIPSVLGIDYALPDETFRYTTSAACARRQENILTYCPEVRFDAVCSFDVFEHLQDDLALSRMLTYWTDWAPRALFGVANMSDKRVINGEEVELHTIQQPPEWWVNRLHAAGWRKVEVEVINVHRFGLWCGSWA